MRQDQHVGVADGGREPPGACLGQPSVAVSVGLRAQRRLLLEGRPSHPVSHSAASAASAAASRHGLGRTMTSAPSRPKASSAAATASGPSRRPRAVGRR